MEDHKDLAVGRDYPTRDGGTVRIVSSYVRRDDGYMTLGVYRPAPTEEDEPVFYNSLGETHEPGRCIVRPLSALLKQWADVAYRVREAVISKYGEPDMNEMGRYFYLDADYRRVVEPHPNSRSFSTVTYRRPTSAEEGELAREGIPTSEPGFFFNVIASTAADLGEYFDVQRDLRAID